MNITVPDLLRHAAATYEKRNAVYGSNYEMVGPVMATFFPNGVREELLRHPSFHLFELACVKMSRFAISEFQHIDSAHDLAVYAAMMESIAHKAAPANDDDIPF